MNGIVVKDIEFNGSILKAVQDVDYTIYVAVRWICEGLGLNEDRMKYERKKIQKDLVLNKGVKFYPLGNDNAKSDVLCLMLDYLPLWLAKISITPSMKKENPELAEELVTYQLKAKDVLTEAFIKNKPVAENSNIIQLQMPTIPDYTENIQALNDKIDRLYLDMGRLTEVILRMESERINNNSAMSSSPVVVKRSEVNVGTQSEYTRWKNKIYSIIDKLILGGVFDDRRECLKYLYDYMNKNYGIVFEQDLKEYLDKNGIKVSNLVIIYNNETYRSIFESVLYDLVSNKIKQNENTVCLTDQIIAPLIEKYNDKSNAGNVTYKRVYKKMDSIKSICWSNRETRYINKYGKKTASKKNVINANKALLKIFKEAVKQMLEDVMD